MLRRVTNGKLAIVEPDCHLYLVIDPLSPHYDYYNRAFLESALPSYETGPIAYHVLYQKLKIRK